MSNPRKFSEKIALHAQKQAEETAAFDEIMREVSRIPFAVSRTSSKMKLQRLDLDNLGPYRGGSLPNVNQLVNQSMPKPKAIDPKSSIDLQEALSNLESMKHQQNSLVSSYGTMSSLTNMVNQRERTSSTSSSRSTRYYTKRDNSPYSQPYLSPPSTDTWRRANSDSALHSSTLSASGQHYSPFESKGPSPANSKYLRDSMSPSRDSPKSAGHSPVKTVDITKQHNVLGMNMFPSQPQDGEQIIIQSANTGSLPDLTSLHFPSPLVTPLEDPSDDIYQFSLNRIVNQIPNSSPNYRQNGMYDMNYSQQHSQRSTSGSNLFRKNVHTDPNSPKEGFHQKSQANYNIFKIDAISKMTQFSPTFYPVPDSFNSLPQQFTGVNVASDISFNKQLTNSGQYLPPNVATRTYAYPLSQACSNQSPKGQLPSAMLNNSYIPDITLTDANYMNTYMKDIDSLLSPDCQEALNLEPLDLDNLQMLDNDIIADPATEDSFRLDRL